MILYGRVSPRSGQQREIGKPYRSVNDQLNVLREWAQRERWPILGEYRDDGRSASDPGAHRPDWERVMQMIESGKVRALLAWEISRNTRDRAVWAALIAACQDNQVMIGLDGVLRDPNDPDDAFALDLGAMLGVRESAMTRKRVLRAVESRAKDGRPHTRLPYGYRRKIDPATGKRLEWVHDPQQAKVVREIVRRVLKGEPVNAITEDLNRRGVHTRTGKPWRPGNVTKLILRPVMAGIHTHHGTPTGVEAQWKPIISVDDHHRLVAMFGSSERDKFRNSTHVKYLGTGLFECGREGCDGRMRVAVRVGDPDRYDCRACHKLSRHRVPVDRLVEAAMIARLSKPDALEAFLAGDVDEGERQAAAAEVVALQAEMNQARAELKTGRLKPVDMATYREGWEQRIADAESRARPRSVPDAVLQMVGPDAGRRWYAAPIGMRRTVLDALARVTILPVGHGGGRFNPDYIDIYWKTAADRS